jgi:hypothetical protein
MTEFEMVVVGLLRFAVLSAGLTYYLTQSVLFAGLRAVVARVITHPVLVYLIYCPPCVGTWVGLVLFFAIGWPLGDGPYRAAEAMVASCVINVLMPTVGPHVETKEG